MKRIYRNYQNPIPKWIPHEYMLDDEEDAANLPTKDVPADSRAYTVNESLVMKMGTDGQWHDITLTVHPDTSAAESAAAAAESAAAAQEAADHVTTATVEEAKDYLGI